MKRNLSIALALIAALSILFAGISVAAAADNINPDVMLSAKILDKVTKLDRNGKPYVRMIVEDTRVKDGVSYTTSAPVMAFGQMAIDKVATLKKGDTLNAIVSQSVYRGKLSYTLIAMK